MTLIETRIKFTNLAEIPVNWGISFIKSRSGEMGVLACHPRALPRYIALLDLPRPFDRWLSISPYNAIVKRETALCIR